MRERGRYQIQLMKTRSSSGVGMKVDLDFDIETLRITDPGEEAQGTPGFVKPQVGSIMNQIKAKSLINNNQEDTDSQQSQYKERLSLDKPVHGEANSTKLKAMLAGLKKVE